jgi:hypothetical protein
MRKNLDHVHDLTKVLFLDIETVPAVPGFGDLDAHAAKLFADKTRFEQERSGKSVEEIYGERGGILAEFGKIICIGVGGLKRDGDHYAMRATSFHGDDERAILMRFTEMLHKNYNSDEHWLCGHNGREFDFPWIARRCTVHGIRLPRSCWMWPARSPGKWASSTPCSIWSFGDRKNFTSLALLTHILGIPTPKDDIGGADVARVYYQDKDVERIANVLQEGRGGHGTAVLAVAR